MLHRNLTVVAAAISIAVSLGLSSVGFANDHIDPGKGPPDCPGAPGAFIGGAALELVEQQTPPGAAVRPIAQDPNGRGAGDAVQEALVNDCGIGALPPEN